MIKGDHKKFCQLVKELRESAAWERLQYDNKELAKVLGCSERTLYRWLAGDSPVPLTVVFLLEVLLKKRKGMSL